MKTKLRIVLDTNVLLVSLSSHFQYYWVYESLQNGLYDLCVSNEILTEYLEKAVEKYGLERSNATFDFLLLLPNVFLINPYFHWNLISQDADDNKFVDCAIAGNCDYIITNDKHFDILKNIEFPKVQTLKINEFQGLFL
jgi:uncharacterized protein